MNTLTGLGLALAGMAWKASADDSLRTALAGLDPPPYRLKPRCRTSLIVPAYNELKYLGNLLRSAHNQVEAFDELVVADCSDPGEGTAQLARSWGARVVAAPKGNIAASRNIGAKAARGDIFVFADADMIFSQHFTEKALDVLSTGVVLTHPREAMYDSMGWHLALHLPQMLRGNHEPSGCMAIRAKDFWAVGGYDEACNPMVGSCHEDTQFGHRVVAKYGPAAVRLVPVYIGASARRFKTFGVFRYGPNFATPVRSRFPRDGVQQVTQGR